MPNFYLLINPALPITVDTNRSSDSLWMVKRLAKKLDKPISFYDLETTGFVAASNFAVVSIAFTHVFPDGRILEQSSLINPGFPIPPDSTKIHGITDEMVKNAPRFDAIIPDIRHILHNNVMSGYNISEFDNAGLTKEFARFNESIPEFKDSIDVRTLYYMDTECVNGMKGKLVEVGAKYGIVLEGSAHNAAYDTRLTTEIAEAILIRRGLTIIEHPHARMVAKEVYRIYENKKAEAKYSTRNIGTSSPPSTAAAGDTKLGFVQEKILTIITAHTGYLEISSLVQQTGLDEFKVSTAIGDLLSIPEHNHIADKLRHPQTQQWMQRHIAEAVSSSGYEDHKRLKPVYQYLQMQEKLPGIVLDYNQLRLALADKNAPKPTTPFIAPPKTAKP